ncbi:MAG: nitrite reductase [Marinilabiliales bacterium]|nr:MAG: nitrite reductase [Marinilabiliales bacterium]
MKEELIISGRENFLIDPYIHIWEWQIPVYLFIGGLAAGLIFFSSLYFIQGKEEKMPFIVKIIPTLVPLLLVFGLFALFLDLKHKLYFWQLYTTIKLESPMSWGAWTLMIVTPLSIVWSLSYLKEIFEHWQKNYPLLYKLTSWIEKLILRLGIFRSIIKLGIKQRKPIAWIMLVMSVILGIYTGILLSAFNARPLWNTSILGPLFLVSGFSTAAATILLFTKDKSEQKLFSKIDLLLIAIEIFLIIHLFMGFLASTTVQIEAAQLFLGGPFTVSFWVFVVFIGLIIPAILEVLELKGFHIPVAIPAILILIGGLILRFIIVEAGQITRYLY